MTSIATAVFKVTIGLLVNKGRHLAAERVKDGDVTDQQFIKSKLDGLARMHILASFSFFKEGLQFLYQLFDQAKTTGIEEDKLAVSLRSTTGGLKPSVNTGSLAEGLENLNLTELDEPAEQTISNAKQRFKEAQREATLAFSNEVLKTSDRIRAMAIRVMATLLETVDNPATALESCRVCLEKLHRIPAVQTSFKVELEKEFESLLNWNERIEVIADVLHINYVIYNIAQMVSGSLSDTFTLPCIDIGKRTIDPLREPKLVKTLREFNMEHCCVVWSFGREGEGEHKVKAPKEIATNTQGQLIVVCGPYRNVKVFSTSGKFLYSLRLPTDEADKARYRRVATDGEDNVYVLALLESGNTWKWGVYVFDQHADLHHMFPLREGSHVGGGFFFGRGSMTVGDHHQVFVLVKRVDGIQVEVYDIDGRFVHSFGQGILKDARDITAAKDRLMVLDCDNQCVHLFSAQGDHLHQFPVHGEVSFGGIAFSRSSEHVVVSSVNQDNEYRGQVSIYIKHGKLVRSIQLDTEKGPWLLGVTVTVDGRIGVTSHFDRKVYVV